eukprot:GAHX01000120.1.p1 GENE.GAHX01000120.1~~GAHX01000120.1.p1  ORF type:complete len:174 (+),score=40.33 GAHX01000120.1:62-583(+)
MDQNLDLDDIDPCLDDLKKQMDALENETISVPSLQSGEISVKKLKGASSLTHVVKKQEQIDKDKCSIYIGNVEYSLTSEQIRDFFSSVGEVVRVTKINNPKTGHPMGYAYVEFGNIEDARTALLKNGDELGGRELSVMPKRTNVKNYHWKKASRGRRGRRFRGPRGGYRNSVA